MIVYIKRVYDNKRPDGTYRVLVDRIWPRAVKKDDLFLNEWNKEITPSPELRKWFNHNEERFNEFAIRYRLELSKKEDELQRLRTIAATQPLTLLFGAKSLEINHAVILKNALLRNDYKKEVIKPK